MKYVHLLVLLFAAWVILSLSDRPRAEKRVVQPRIPNYSWGEVQDIFAREEALDAELKQIQLYHNNHREILSRLRQERITLRNAATALDNQAREIHPRLHEGLEGRYPSLSSVERMALRLLEQLEEDGCQATGIERLCSEMTTWSKADPTQFRQPRPLKPR